MAEKSRKMTKMRVVILAATAFAVGYLFGSWQMMAKTLTAHPESGRFHGTPRTEWGIDGRTMTLLDDFVFVDGSGRGWVAEKGVEVNGASIPKLFWSIIGGPFEGKYRNASIVHDAECIRMNTPSAEVHRMFYDACRAGGVEERDAKLLYWAVANYGPQWKLEKLRTFGADDLPDDNAKLTGEPVLMKAEPVTTKELSQKEIDWAVNYFKEKNPRIEVVPFLAPPH
jgi:Protein of unknown function (DUF1353)